MPATTFSWRVASGGGVHTTTQARGALAMIDVDTRTPNLRLAAPDLPWEDAPAGAAKTSLPYAAFAIYWAAVKSIDEPLLEGNSIQEICLEVDAMARLDAKLAALKFDFKKKRSVGQLVDDLEAFVVASDDPHFMLLGADLGPLSSPLGPTGAAAERLKVGDEFIGDFNLLHIRKSSSSLARMVPIEHWLAPRLLRTDRYATSSPFLRFFLGMKTIVAQHDEELKAAMADATPDTDLIRELTTEAVAHRLQHFSCPNTMITFDYSKLDVTHVARTRSVAAVNRFEGASIESRDAQRKAVFMQYARPYEQIFKVTCHLSAGDQAHHLTKRLAQHFKLGTDLERVTMDALDHILLTAATFCDIPANVTMDAKTRTQQVLDQTDSAPGAPLSTSTGPSFGSLSSGESRTSHTLAQKQYMQSLLVVTLENLLRPKLAASPPDHRFVITKILRAKQSLLTQLILNLRPSVPGGDVWETAHAMHVHVQEALAFSMTSKEDSKQILQQPAKLRTFADTLTTNNVKALTQLKFGSTHANMHQLAHTIRNTISDGSKDRTPRTAIKYGDIHANEAYMTYAERVCYFVGYRNGVYGDYISPINEILLEAPDADEDDFLDVQEACTEAIIIGHTEMAKHMAVFLDTSSPSIMFPFGGDRLTAEDGPYAAKVAEIKEQMPNPHSLLYKRRRQKLKDLNSIPKKMQQLDGLLRQGTFM